MTNKRFVAICVIFCLGVSCLLGGCRSGGEQKSVSKQELNPFRDVRGFTKERVLEQLPEGHISDLREYQISESVLWSLCYNEKTVFPEGENLDSGISPQELLELAKNPGLGIRGLHERGYTGEGVTVAIIDRPVMENHPEFAGKIVKYKDFCDGADWGNMHGPAVASALAGETTGTAPGVKMYFAGAGEVLTTAQALDWIVEENEKLPEGEKIRVVSISMAPNDLDSPDAEQWLESRERAEATGLLVLDADRGHGLFSPAYFDIAKGDWESPAGLLPGQWNRPWEKREQYEEAGYYEEGLFVPISPRTLAEQYSEEDFSYQYYGVAGLSWGIPYAAGVLAMGWQIAPEKSGEEMVALLLETAYERDGMRFIYPKAFIEALLEEKAKEVKKV